MAGEIKLGVEAVDAELEVMNKRAIAFSIALPGYYAGQQQQLNLFQGC